MHAMHWIFGNYNYPRQRSVSSFLSPKGLRGFWMAKEALSE